MSAKVPTVVRLAKQALMENKCVVIDLQSTGEVETEEALSKYVGYFRWFFILLIAYQILICLDLSEIGP